MARLIVEDSQGQPRVFQVRAGKLTIGSGAQAKLSLPDSELAEVHAELEVGKDSAVLRLRRGVRPAKVGGRAITGEWTMAHGQTVELGDVQLRIEYESASGSLVERRTKTTKAEVARRGAAATSSAAGAGRPRAGAPRIERSTPTRRSPGFSVPSWGILLIAAVVLFVGYKISQSYVAEVGEAGFDPNASFQKIEIFLKDSDIKSAEAELARVDARADLDPAWKARFEPLRAQIAQRREEGDKLVDHGAGSEYLETQIKRYETDRLSKGKDRPKVRVLLKRLDHFKRTWPDHPEIDLVNRMRDRYDDVVELSDPMTFEDLSWEVHTLTWAMPRDYRQAFQLIEEFAEMASPAERESADEFAAEKRREEKEYFEERLLQAKYLWEQDNGKSRGEAVEWLVQLAIKLDDPELVDEATTRLLAIPDIDRRWGGYREGRPETYQALLANSRVRKHLQDRGIM